MKMSFYFILFGLVDDDGMDGRRRGIKIKINPLDYCKII